MRHSKPTKRTTNTELYLYLWGAIAVGLFALLIRLLPLFILILILLPFVFLIRWIVRKSDEKAAVKAELESIAHTPLPLVSRVIHIRPRDNNPTLNEFTQQINKYSELSADLSNKEQQIQCYHTRADAYEKLKNEVEQKNCINKAQDVHLEISPLKQKMSEIRNAFSDKYLRINDVHQRELFQSFVSAFSETERSPDAPSLIMDCHVVALKEYIFRKECVFLLRDFGVIFHKDDNSFTYIPYDSIKVHSNKKTDTINWREYSQGDVIKGYTYLHVNKDGSPDRRYKDNPEMIVVERGYVTVEFVGEGFSCSYYLDSKNFYELATLQSRVQEYLDYMKKVDL